MDRRNNLHAMLTGCLKWVPFFLLAVGNLTSTTTAQETRRPFDVLITGSRIMDGTGNPWYAADVGIRDGRIVAVGRLDAYPADRRIDATGRVTAPGFIDLHSHAEGPGGSVDGLRAHDPRLRSAHNLVSQGVTTLVANQDGRSPRSIGAQRAQLEAQGFGPNVALLVGHNTVRAAVLGDDHKRRATTSEIERMQHLIRVGMAEGAYGLSAGLEYVPGRWSDTDEVVALVEAVKPGGGVFIVHERSSGSDPMWYVPSQDSTGPLTMLDNVIEMIEVAERSGVPTVATHIKVRGADYWGTSQSIIYQIERARARGVEIWADQYPYNSSGTDGNTVLIPDWALDRDRWGAGLALQSGEGPRPALSYPRLVETVLQDSRTAADLKRDIAREIERRGGPENIVIFEYPDSNWVGQSLAVFAEARAVSPVEGALLLQSEGFTNRPGGARLRGFSFAEGDIEGFAARPWVATASDAGVAVPEQGPVHARFYGTFPRKIKHYALDRGVVTVEDAVRSMTSLPAQVLGLKDRGQVREGFVADLVVLDLDRLQDTATFFDPHQYAEGIEHVLINGTFAVEDGRLTGALAGTILTPADSRRAPRPAAE